MTSTTCSLSRSASASSLESQASCVAQAGCGWCGDSTPGQCAAGGVDGPAAASECFAWHYGEAATETGGGGGGAGAGARSFSYLQAGQLLDYAAHDGSDKVWRLAKPPRAGCPAVQWPAEASGTRTP